MIRLRPTLPTVMLIAALATGIASTPSWAAPAPRAEKRVWGWGMEPDTATATRTRSQATRLAAPGSIADSTLRVPPPAGPSNLRSEPPPAMVKSPRRAFEAALADSGPATESARSSLPASRAIDYLWVVRGALADSVSIDSVVARARAMGVRGLLAQVVGRADAWYRSDLLPRPEALSGARADFDPLGALIARAKPAGLEVHAWVNCLLVWSAPKPPRDRRHLLHAHPEWVAALPGGVRMTRLDERDLREIGVEGVFLTPAHPGVRAFVGAVAREIATRYPVDGIHLDYIRQPGVAIGFDPTTRARFALESGIDPERFDAVEPAARAAIDSAWAAFQREQVTAVVRAVRDSLADVRADLVLSAAVIADTITAERANAQCWRGWVRDGLVDRVFPMCYAPSVQRVMDQLAAFGRELGTTGRVVPGIAVFNTSPSTAAFKILGARTLGFPSVALYSYDVLFADPPLWASLRDRIATHGRNP